MKDVVLSPSRYVPGIDSLLAIFIKNYVNNDKFSGILFTSLLKSYISKVDGVSNPQYGTDILNFFLAFSSSGDKEDFYFVSCNLCGVSLSWIKILQQRDYHPLLLDSLDIILINCS